jgi:hypothetical protein
MVPCRLPHQTRYDDVWPPGNPVEAVFSGQERTDWEGGEVNLLSESKATAKTNGGFESFVSFENTLMTLGDQAHEYQCVWNASGITDNRALAGGVSASLFPPAKVYEDGNRGTKACRASPLDGRSNDNVKFPVLPLPGLNLIGGGRGGGLRGGGGGHIRFKYGICNLKSLGLRP